MAVFFATPFTREMKWKAVVPTGVAEEKVLVADLTSDRTFAVTWSKPSDDYLVTVEFIATRADGTVMLYDLNDGDAILVSAAMLEVIVKKVGRENVARTITRLAYLIIERI